MTYPLIAFGVIIYCLITYGVKNRAYYQYIQKGRRLETADGLGIDLDDVDSYPTAVYTEYLAKKKYDNYIVRKDEKIDIATDQFHEFLELKAKDTTEKRAKRGLRKRNRSSPLEKVDFEKWQQANSESKF